MPCLEDRRHELPEHVALLVERVEHRAHVRRRRNPRRRRGGGGGGGVTPVAGLLALRDLRLDARHQLVDLPKHIPPEFSSNFLGG